MPSIHIKSSPVPELRFPGEEPWDRDQFLEFCERNPEVFAELDQEGNLIIMTPANPDADRKNALLLIAIGNWIAENGMGEIFGPSAGFTLPSGAVRSPDVSIVLKEDWQKLGEGEHKHFAMISPFFVLELRSSESDRLAEAQAKMQEYIDNGTRLGWLVDPVLCQLTVYRPGQAPELLERPKQISGDPELPGLTIDLARIWG